MKTIKVTTNSSTKTIEATEVVKVLNFKKFDTLCLKTPIKLDGEVLPAGSNIDFGENATIEMDGHSVKGAANLFVNSEMASLNCQKPVEDSLAVLNASNAVGAPIDLNDISGGVGPFTYHISIHLDTTNFINSYFVVELKLSAFTLVNVHLDANHPSVTFGNTVLGVGVKGTLGVDFNGGRIYVEAELRTPFGCKKVSADIYSWKNYRCLFFASPVAESEQYKAASNASSGWISIENKGGYVAKFDVSYMQKGKRITEESGDFTAGVTKVIDIPSDATDIVLHAWDAWFIKSWTEIFSKHFDGPVRKKYKVTGTTLHPDYEELPV